MSSSGSIFPEPQRSRLVTIAAHVDHGKTTLADNLISYNGIISERLAGTIRYLDSDPEEQRRGITMRASAVGIRHRYVPPRGKKKQKKKKAADAEAADHDEQQQQRDQQYIVHLVDSPGHADFRQEVTTSLLACDIAVIVLDVVEGMGARTHQVLRETYAHSLFPILMLNKIDRLCTELCLSPVEAYLRIRTLLETVNAACSAMLTAAENTSNSTSGGDTTTTKEEHDDDERQRKAELERQEKLWTFEPSTNVVFGSALHGFGFTVTSLARSLFQSKLVDIKPLLLKHYLFGDYKYRQSDGKVLKWKYDDTSQSNDDSVCMFAEFALKPLWQIYEGVASATSADTQALSSSDNGMDRVLRAMQIANTTATGESNNNKNGNSSGKITSMQELKDALSTTGSNTEQSVLRCVLRRYRDLSTSLLDLICEHGPSPVLAQSSLRSNVLQLQEPTAASRATTASATPEEAKENLGEEKLGDTNNNTDDDDFARIQESVANCDPNGPCVAQISKFMCTDVSHIRDAQLQSQHQQDSDKKSDNNESDSNDVLLGLARVLSGKLRTGQSYYCLGPKHKYRASAVQKPVRLYVVMGSSFVLVDEVPAGNLCAVSNLHDLQLKTVTLCDLPNCMPLRGFHFTKFRPLLKVNIEPEDASDADLLERGLMKLSLADAAVEVTATAKGERILACLGELHLEQSIHDLKQVYCGGGGFDDDQIKLRISDPIIEFGETTDWFPNESDYNSFYDSGRTAQPLRQMTIPPYNEEEGLAHAQQGRMRSILTGRAAAIQLRVVPLSDAAYKSIEQRLIIDKDNSVLSAAAVSVPDELFKIGRVLKIGVVGEDSSSSNNTNLSDNGEVVDGATTSYAEIVLQALCNNLCSKTSNGNNVLVETPGLRQGRCVHGVVCDEVYVPPSSTTSADSHPNNTSDNDIIGDEDTAAKNAFQNLQDCIREIGFQSVSKEADGVSSNNNNISSQENDAAFEIWNNEMKGSAALGGFQMAVRAGPICEEPIRNVLVVLEGVEIALTRKNQQQHPKDHNDRQIESKEKGKQHLSRCWECTKPLSGGTVVSALRIGIRCALLSRPVRLMEGMLRLTLHSSLGGLGPLYSVLSKRRGRVVDESMVDDGTTDLLEITALIPQAEAFGLTSEFLKKTRGHVTAPEMIFGHWEMLKVDPFWVPTTEEEREDYGENIVLAGDTSTGVDNPALGYIRKVRQRKGCKIDSSRTVIAAEKQRTLKR